MKTIEVSDEMYDKLIELSKEMTSQDHRSTAMPYLFQIREKKRVDGVDDRYGSDGHVWLHKNGGTPTESDRESMIYALENDDVVFDKEAVTDEKLEELLEEEGYEKGFFRIEEVYSNAFLTEKACKEHIRLNAYHYSEPVDYLKHAFRNPDMELISKFICELAGGKMHA